MVARSAVPGGWTAAERALVALADGRRAFVKAATSPETAEWLRAELRVYEGVSGSFMAVALGWDDDGRAPVLLLEDLSGGRWPPPWDDAGIAAVLNTLERVHGTSTPSELPALADLRGELDGWPAVAADPGPFLALGLCTPGWLERSLEVLAAASAAAVLEGDDLCHLDVRSDNICFIGERVVLVDWNHACIGNGVVDVAGWLPSLEREGGPAPESVLEGEPEIAALLAGYWAARAGLPPPRPGSRVRTVQVDQLRSALPWAARALSLPEPDGANHGGVGP